MLLIAASSATANLVRASLNALRLTDDEIADFRHIATLVYERYFGVPVPDEYRELALPFCITRTCVWRSVTAVARSCMNRVDVQDPD